MNLQIASAAEEQSAVADNITQHVNQIHTSMQEAVAAVKENSQLSGQLRSLVQGVQNVLRRFQLTAG